MWYAKYIQQAERGTLIIFTSEINKALCNIVEKERPDSLLVISGESSFCCEILSDDRGGSVCTVLDTSCSITRFKQDFSDWQQMSDADVLFKNDIWCISDYYDMILVVDLFEAVPISLALGVLDKLLRKTKKQVLAICPKFCNNTTAEGSSVLQKYHPTVFRNFDFSYSVLANSSEIETQFYSFYPKPSTVSKCSVYSTAAILKGERFFRLAYILPDQELTGGMKQLLIQMAEMHSRGHNVIAFSKSETARTVLPDWCNITEHDIDGQFVLKPDENYLDHVRNVDAIIIGWMDHVTEFKGTNTPVFLWEQGSSPLFGDFKELLHSNSAEIRKFRSCYQPPIKVLAVSPLVKTILKARFGIESTIVSAAIDAPPHMPRKMENAIKQILLVGNSEQDFKNFEFAIEALMLAKKNGIKFETSWITQNVSSKKNVPEELDITYHISPKQEQLFAIYNSADLFISHSLYESFSLPPLEAMAAGTAVLSLNNGGIETYAINGVNCMLCDQGDIESFVKGMQIILSDDDLRKKLAESGYITARRFSRSHMCDALEGCLRQVLQ